MPVRWKRWIGGGLLVVLLALIGPGRECAQAGLDCTTGASAWCPGADNCCYGTTVVDVRRTCSVIGGAYCGTYASGWTRQEITCDGGCDADYQVGRCEEAWSQDVIVGYYDCSTQRCWEERVRRCEEVWKKRSYTECDWVCKTTTVCYGPPWNRVCDTQRQCSWECEVKYYWELVTDCWFEWVERCETVPQSCPIYATVLSGCSVAPLEAWTNCCMFGSLPGGGGGGSGGGGGEIGLSAQLSVSYAALPLSAGQGQELAGEISGGAGPFEITLVVIPPAGEEQVYSFVIAGESFTFDSAAAGVDEFGADLPGEWSAQFFTLGAAGSVASNSTSWMVGPYPVYNAP